MSDCKHEWSKDRSGKCNLCGVWRHHGNVDLCDDCGATKPVVTWGLGTVRCSPCSDAWGEKCRAKREEEARLEQEALNAHIAAWCPDDGLSCRNCCQHEYDPEEGFSCLNCGDDGADYIAGMIDAAMARAEDA